MATLLKYIKETWRISGYQRAPLSAKGTGGDAFEPIITLIKLDETPAKPCWDCGNDIVMKLFATVGSHTNPNSGAFH